MLKNAQKDFIQRHIGASKEEQKVMLKELGYNNLDELIAKTVPKKILSKDNLSIGDSNSEYKALRKLRDISQRITSFFLKKSSVGLNTKIRLSKIKTRLVGLKNT